MADPIGPDNDHHIARLFRECLDRKGVAVVGWGAHGAFLGRAAATTQIAWRMGLSFKCLGVTKNGQPRHPLYVPSGAELVPFSP